MMEDILADPQLFSVADVLAREQHPFLFATVSGSHQYGFHSADSDIDVRGIHVLSLREVIGLHEGQSTREVTTTDRDIEVDVVTHDIKKFARLLLGKNGNVLENLYSPLVLGSSPEYEELKHLSAHCITKYHYKHYLGFAGKQWKLLSRQVQRERKGIKALLYLYRVLLTGLFLMQTGQVEANINTLNDVYKLPYLPDLVARKLAGQEHDGLSEEEVALHTDEYGRLCEALREAASESSLPERVADEDEQALHEFVIRVRMEYAS